MPRWSAKKIDPPEYYIRLKDVRIALGLFIIQMAELVDIPEVTYLTYEQNGTVEIKPAVFARFALKLGVSVDYLLGLTDIPKAYAEKRRTGSYDTADTSRIRELRLSKGFTGKAVAEKLDVSAGAYSTKELHPDVLAFTIEDIIRIAKLFGTSADYLLNITDETVAHHAGKHKKAVLGAGETRRIKSRLGILKTAVTSDADMKEYCRTHFNLRRIRQERSLLQEQVAEAVGLNLSTYGMYERNPHLIPAYYLIKLAYYYGVTTDYLLGRDEEDVGTGQAVPDKGIKS